MVAVNVCSAPANVPISIAYVVTPGATLGGTLWNYSGTPAFANDTTTIRYYNNTGVLQTTGRWSYMVTLLC